MQNTNPFSPGVKTSEFKVSVFAMLLTSGLSYLASSGFIHIADVNPIVNAVGQIYGGAVGLLTIFAIARSYVQSRTAIKTTLINSGSTPQVPSV